MSPCLATNSLSKRSDFQQRIVCLTTLPLGLRIAGSESFAEIESRAVAGPGCGAHHFECMALKLYVNIFLNGS